MQAFALITRLSQPEVPPPQVAFRWLLIVVTGN